MSAVKTRTPVLSASSLASLVTGTSNARMTANWRPHTALTRLAAAACRRRQPRRHDMTPALNAAGKGRMPAAPATQATAASGEPGLPRTGMHAGAARAFFRPFSSITLARMTSRRCTGPMLMPDTGIFTVGERRNSSRASSEPSVLAWTQTPSPGGPGPRLSPHAPPAAPSRARGTASSARAGRRARPSGPRTRRCPACPPSPPP